MLMNLNLLEKPWKMWQNSEISNIIIVTLKRLFSIRFKIPYYKVFLGKFFGYRNIKIPQTYSNEAVYLGLSILELLKMVMYESWYDYVKPKYGKKAKLCYMSTVSLYT